MLVYLDTLSSNQACHTMSRVQLMNLKTIDKQYECFQFMSPVSILCINASCACDDNGLTTHWTYDTPSHLPTPVIFSCFSSDNESRIANSDMLVPTILSKFMNKKLYSGLL